MSILAHGAIADDPRRLGTADAMPFSLRVAGVDLSIGGPPLAGDVSRLLSSRANVPALLSVASPVSVAPPGFRTQKLIRVIGHGSSDWRRAARALETADALDLPWARFWRGGRGNRWATGDAVVVGARVLVPGLWVANVNRIVSFCRRRNRVSVAWGTTARHVLRGEEVLSVERRSNGDVVFALRSFSRPKSFISWLAYPYVVYLQRKFAFGVYRRIEQITRASKES